MASGQTGPPGSYQMYQQPYQQPYQPARKPLGDYIKMLVSDTVLALCVWFGLLLAFIGAVVNGVVDGEGGKEFGLVVKALGVLLVTWGLVIGGMLRHDMEKWVRFAMILAGAAILVVVGFWPWSIGVDVPTFG